MEHKYITVVSNGFSAKTITVEQLRDILKEIPDDYNLMPNGSGNISVLTSRNKFIGNIDIVQEKYLKKD